MAITFESNFPDITNQSYKLKGPSTKGVTLRIRSGMTAPLGTVTIKGASPTCSVTLRGNPIKPGWLDWSYKDGIVSVNANAPLITEQLTNVYIMVVDGQDTAYFALSIDVKPGFTLVTTRDQMVSIPMNTYKTVPPIIIQGRGDQGTQIMGATHVTPPSVLPKGMTYSSSDGTQVELRVDPASFSDPSGGLKEAVSGVYNFYGYCPGTMYDTPERAFPLSLTINGTSGPTAELESGLSCNWDTAKGYYSLNLHSDFTNGVIPEVTYKWTVPGGTTSGGGGVTDKQLLWVPPTTAATTTLTCAVIQKATGNTLRTHAITLPTSSAADASWTTGVRAQFSSPLTTYSTGDTVKVNLSVNPSDIGANTWGAKFTLVTSNGVPLSAPTTLKDIPSGTSSVEVQIPIPQGLSDVFQNMIFQKLILTAEVTVGSTPKIGRTSTVVMCKGQPQLTISGPTSLEQKGPTPVDATYLCNQPGAVFSLKGGPAGLTIINGKLSGNVLMYGNQDREDTFTFSVVATKEGYAPSDPHQVTLKVLSPTSLAFDFPLPSKPAPVTVDDNTQFTLDWSRFGNPNRVWLQRNLEQPWTVGNSLTYNTSIVGTSVFSLVAEDYRGWAYNTPVVVGSNSIVKLDGLPNSQVIATVDRFNNLDLSWHPTPIGGNYAPYLGWTILTRSGKEPEETILINGKPPTGLETDGTQDARKLNVKVKAGQLAMNMFALSANQTQIANGTPYPTFLEFPEPFITEGASPTFILDKTDASKGESITLSLSPKYRGGQQWRVSYGDEFKTEWYPLTNANLARSFQSPGTKTITVEVRKDYPDVQLTLVRTTTLTVWIKDQEYNPGVIINTGGIGGIGIGGEAGFEITEATNGVSPSEAYEVIVRALVSDTTTQEVKLLVATARTRDASSLKGTMALDVFPIVGRPHLKDLVKPTGAGFSVSTVTPVKIEGKDLPPATVGKPLKEVVLQAKHGTLPYSWYSDNLPPGLRLSIDGTLSGSVLKSGTYAVNFSVKDSSNPPSLDQAVMLLVAKSDLMIQTSSLPDAMVGTPYKGGVQAGGGMAPYNYTLVSGAESLPKGLTLHPTTGEIQGTPCTWNSTTDFSKPWVITVEVTDSVKSKQSKTLSLTLQPMPLTLGSLDQGDISSALDYTLSVPVYGGVSPYTLTSVSSDGLSQDKLRLLGPVSLVAMSGKASTPVTITGGSMVNLSIKELPGITSYPQSFSLEATGGIPPYSWTILQDKTTLPGAQMTNSGVVTCGIPYKTGDPLTKTYTLNVSVVDDRGRSTTALLDINCTVTPAATQATYLKAFTTDGLATPVVGLIPVSGNTLPPVVWATPGGQGGHQIIYLVVCDAKGAPIKCDDTENVSNGSFSIGLRANTPYPGDSGMTTQTDLFLKSAVGHYPYGTLIKGVTKVVGSKASMQPLKVNVPSLGVGDTWVLALKIDTRLEPWTPYTPGRMALTVTAIIDAQPNANPLLTPPTAQFDWMLPGGSGAGKPMIKTTPLYIKYSYNPTTGSKVPDPGFGTCNITASGGSGTYKAWTLRYPTGDFSSVVISPNNKGWATLTWDPTKGYPDPGNYTAYMSVSDSTDVVSEDVPMQITVTRAIIQPTTIKGLTFTGPLVVEKGKPYEYSMTADGPIGAATLSGDAAYSIQGNTAYFRKTFSSDTQIACKISSAIDPSATYTSQTWSIKVYEKALKVSVKRDSLDLGVEYSPYSGTHPVVWELVGYTPDEAKSVTMTTSAGTLLGNRDFTLSGYGDIPCVGLAAHYKATTLGPVDFVITDPVRKLTAKGTVNVRGSVMNAEGITLDIKVPASEVVSSGGKQVKKTFNYPVKVTNPTGAYTVQWTGSTSTQWSFGVANPDNTFTLDLTNSGIAPAASYRIPVIMKVKDQYSSVDVQGWINMSVDPDNTLVMEPYKDLSNERIWPYPQSRLMAPNIAAMLRVVKGGKAPIKFSNLTLSGGDMPKHVVAISPDNCGFAMFWGTPGEKWTWPGMTNPHDPNHVVTPMDFAATGIPYPPQGTVLNTTVSVTATDATGATCKVQFPYGFTFG